jgi:hypothetical protein
MSLHEREVGNGLSPVTSEEGLLLLEAIHRVQTGILDLHEGQGRLARADAEQAAALTALVCEVRGLADELRQEREKLNSVPDLDAIEEIAEKTGRHILKDEARRVVQHEKLAHLEEAARKRADFAWRAVLLALGGGGGFVCHLLYRWLVSH